jgi:elongation factor 1-gamma
VYSNSDSPEAMKYFVENLDREGYSVWRTDYKYNDELTQVFMSSNLIGGLFARLEGSRKYLFGSMGVLGSANDSIISGVMVSRGQDIVATMNVCTGVPYSIIH